MKHLLVLLVVAFVGCAGRADKTLVYTEEGIRAAEQAWDSYYRAKADDCRSKFKPKTPEMERCFGKTYEADLAVAKALRSVVALLRGYWVARAQGEDPDWFEVVQEVDRIVRDLPPEARQFFEKVRGIP